MRHWNKSYRCPDTKVIIKWLKCYRLSKVPFFVFFFIMPAFVLFCIPNYQNCFLFCILNIMFWFFNADSLLPGATVVVDVLYKIKSIHTCEQKISSILPDKVLSWGWWPSGFWHNLQSFQFSLFGYTPLFLQTLLSRTWLFCRIF